MRPNPPRCAIAVLLFTVVFLAGENSAIARKEAPAAAEEITITAYYGGVAKMTQERTIPFVAGDTAMSATIRALRTATNTEHTFIQSIEGVGNNDTTKDYWLYFVNGEAMHAGAAETKLKPGDRVLWFLRRQSSTTHDPAKK